MKIKPPHDPNQRIGWDWPLVRMNRGPLKGQIIFARRPDGSLVRVTEADVQRAAVGLANIIGPPDTSNDE